MGKWMVNELSQIKNYVNKGSVKTLLKQSFKLCPKNSVPAQKGAVIKNRKIDF